MESVLLFSDSLLHHRKHDLAHLLIDETVSRIRQDRLTAPLYKEKGYICKQEGRDDEALRLFQHALDLEGTGSEGAE